MPDKVKSYGGILNNCDQKVFNLLHFLTLRNVTCICLISALDLLSN